MTHELLFFVALRQGAGGVAAFGEVGTAVKESPGGFALNQLSAACGFRALDAAGDRLGEFALREP